MARQGQPREPCTLDRKVFRGRVLTASRPAGGAWSKPTVLDSHLAITTQTRVAVNSRGAAVAVAVWAHERLPDSDSYASEVSIDRAGNAVVMYERHRGRGAWARRCDAATGVWTPATRLSLASPAGVGDSLAVSANKRDRVPPAVRPEQGPARLADRANASKRNLDAPNAGVRQSPTSTPEGLAIDGHGRALAVWRNKNDDLMVMRGDPRGSWRRSKVLARGQTEAEPLWQSWSP